MVMAITEAFKCIKGMKNCCINTYRDQMRKAKISYKKRQIAEDGVEKELDKYIKSYERLIFGEEKRQTKYWFMIDKKNNITMVFAERCYPKKYQIEDENIWWIYGKNYGLHTNDLYDTQVEAKEALKQKLQNEIKELQTQIKQLEEPKNE
jgi:hypothetical protein